MDGGDEGYCAKCCDHYAWENKTTESEFDEVVEVVEVVVERLKKVRVYKQTWQ